MKASFFCCKRQIPNMGLKSSTLLQEEDIEELQNETGCKYNYLIGFFIFVLPSRRGRLFGKTLFFLSDLYVKCVPFCFFFSVSPNQIRRLYCRFSSLDKATKGTLR